MARDNRKPLPSQIQFTALRDLSRLRDQLRTGTLPASAVACVLERHFRGTYGRARQELQRQGWLVFDTVSDGYDVHMRDEWGRGELAGQPGYPLGPEEITNLAAWIRMGTRNLRSDHLTTFPNGNEGGSGEWRPAPAPEDVGEGQALQILADLQVVIRVRGNPVPAALAGDFFRDRVLDDGIRRRFLERIKNQGWYVSDDDGKHWRIGQKGLDRMRDLRVEAVLSEETAKAELLRRGALGGPKQAPVTVTFDTSERDRKALEASLAEPRSAAPVPTGSSVPETDGKGTHEPAAGPEERPIDSSASGEPPPTRGTATKVQRYLAAHAFVEGVYGGPLPTVLSETVGHLFMRTPQPARTNMKNRGYMEVTQLGYRLYEWSTTEDGITDLREADVVSEIDETKAKALIEGCGLTILQARAALESAAEPKTPAPTSSQPPPTEEPMPSHKPAQADPEPGDPPDGPVPLAPRPPVVLVPRELTVQDSETVAWLEAAVRFLDHEIEMITVELHDKKHNRDHTQHTVDALERCNDGSQEARGAVNVFRDRLSLLQEEIHKLEREHDARCLQRTQHLRAVEAIKHEPAPSTEG